ncbi:MAG: hypothetical protein JXR29_13275 [Methylothermaceae bacterium]|nr:hypothetical protein [Methylothermaceae bacterium]
MRKIPEAHYRIPVPMTEVRPGVHRGMRAESGQLFMGVTDFLRHPDLRRLDVRRSLLDPYLNLHVRIFEQRSAAKLMVAADLSASMGVEASKRQILTDLTTALAWGARRLGDRIGFVGFAENTRRELFMPPLMGVGWLPRWRVRIHNDPWGGRCADGVSMLPRHLPAHRSLVFLVSDFHWPDRLIRLALIRLAKHFVVPIVVWSRNEYENWPNWGLKRVRDAETGRETLLMLRPGWRGRLRQAYGERRHHLTRLFRAVGRRPLWMEDRYDPVALQRYFDSV